jgi:hypothetical protein
MLLVHIHAHMHTLIHSRIQVERLRLESTPCGGEVLESAFGMKFDVRCEHFDSPLEMRSFVDQPLTCLPHADHVSDLTGKVSDERIWMYHYTRACEKFCDYV